MNGNLLNTTEAAAVLGMSKSTLDCWRTRGGGPVYRRVGAKAIRYAMSDLELFASDKRRNTSDPGRGAMAGAGADR